MTEPTAVLHYQRMGIDEVDQLPDEVEPRPMEHIVYLHWVPKNGVNLVW